MKWLAVSLIFFVVGCSGQALKPRVKIGLLQAESTDNRFGHVQLVCKDGGLFIFDDFPAIEASATTDMSNCATSKP